MKRYTPTLQTNYLSSSEVAMVNARPIFHGTDKSPKAGLCGLTFYRWEERTKVSNMRRCNANITIENMPGVYIHIYTDFYTSLQADLLNPPSHPPLVQLLCFVDQSHIQQ